MGMTQRAKLVAWVGGRLTYGPDSCCRGQMRAHDMRQREHETGGMALEFTRAVTSQYLSSESQTAVCVSHETTHLLLNANIWKSASPCNYTLPNLPVRYLDHRSGWVEVSQAVWLCFLLAPVTHRCVKASNELARLQQKVKACPLSLFIN